MASEPILALLDVPVGERSRFAGSTVLSDYWALTKPEVNSLIVVTTRRELLLLPVSGTPNARNKNFGFLAR